MQESKTARHTWRTLAFPLIRFATFALGTAICIPTFKNYLA